MIRFSNQEGFIKPCGIRFREGQDPNIRLPEVGVAVFSRHLFFHIVEKYNAKPVAYISECNFEKDVYILNYKGKDITFFMAGVGGPIMASDLEDLHVHGLNKFIIFGNCGVLDKNIEDCSIIIPTKAFRDEGTSQHYVLDSELIDVNPKYIPEFKDILKEYNMNYTEGYTWTTDAPYRETKEKIDYFKKKGCVCVEMEGTAIAAVCQNLNLDYFTFYYAGDNLDSVEWEERSISGLTNIDKKKEVTYLALELAIIILNSN